MEKGKCYPYVVSLQYEAKASSVCRKREEVEEVDDDIAKEISTAAEGISSNSRGTVDRSDRPSAEAVERSTGPVDRRAQTWTGRSGRPARSTGAVDRPVDRQSRWAVSRNC